jgi:hypothetical protein
MLGDSDKAYMWEPLFETVPGFIDRCDVVTESGEATGVPIRLGDFVIVSGWIVSDGAPIVQAWIMIDGTRSVPAASGLARPDVAADLGRDDAISSGFRAIVAIDGLALGRHKLTIEAVDASGRFLAALCDPYEIEIVDPLAGKDRFLGYFDEIRVGVRNVDPSQPVQMAQSSVVLLRGWAVAGDRTPGLGVFLRTSNRLVPLAYGFDRSDVAELHGERARLSGFMGTFDWETFRGEPRAEVVLLAPDGRSLLIGDLAIEVVMVSGT